MVIEPSTLFMPGKYCSTELHPRLFPLLLIMKNGPFMIKIVVDGHKELLGYLNEKYI